MFIEIPTLVFGGIILGCGIFLLGIALGLLFPRELLDFYSKVSGLPTHKQKD